MTNTSLARVPSAIDRNRPVRDLASRLYRDAAAPLAAIFDESISRVLNHPSGDFLPALDAQHRHTYAVVSRAHPVHSTHRWPSDLLAVGERHVVIC